MPENIWLYCKNETDILIKHGARYEIDGFKSPRRCGGLGDVLSGVIAALISMSADIQAANDIRLENAILFAGELVRRSSQMAFQNRSRSMTASDVINNIHICFDKMIEE